MNKILKVGLTITALVIGAQASAQVTFYENEGFSGRSFTADKSVDDFARWGFNDRASSVVVLGDRWEACDDAHFGGRCVVLRAGRYRTPFKKPRG